MNAITTHVLDTSRGKPAEGIRVQLEFNEGQIGAPNWATVGDGTTNPDGRIEGLVADAIQPGHYRISFQVA
ncbi:MAG: hydroxyisourate hydrolase, partial [Pirellulaceae bacterium]